MELYVKKESDVSLHNQIVTQLSMQIASGVLPAGAKLSSIRALSKKLGIHYNTCLSAYKELESLGLIEIRQGSGAYVKTLDKDKAALQTLAPDLKDLTTFFVSEVKQQGYRWDDVLVQLNQIYSQMQGAEKTLFFVDLHADILPVFQAELFQTIGLSVQPVALDSVISQTSEHSHFIVSRYHYQALKELLSVQWPGESLDERITMIEVGSGQQELGRIRQLPEGSLVSIVSKCSIILNQAEAVLNAVCGDELLIRTVLYGTEPALEVERILKASKAVFADYSCIDELHKLTSKPIQLIQTIPAHELEKLKNLFCNQA